MGRRDSCSYVLRESTRQPDSFPGVTSREAVEPFPIPRCSPEEDGRDILAALADRGIKVELDDDGRLRARPARLLDESDRELLTAYREAVAAALRADGATTCPSCGIGDYLPLGGGWRRCWGCGRRWGAAGTMDPGDPPDLARLEAVCLDDPSRREDRMERDGEEILAALAARGIKVWLDRDGRPRAGPRERLGDADRELLVAHREAVLATLGGHGRGQHERLMHGGRPGSWWRRADGELVCGICHPPVTVVSPVDGRQPVTAGRR